MPFIHFLINNNLWIALCAVCFACQTYLSLSVPIQIDSLLIIIFSATLVGYLVPQILALRSIPKNFFKVKKELSKQKKVRVLLLIAAFISCLGVFFFQKKGVQFGLLFSGSITLLYSLPLVKWRGKPMKLREIGCLKIFWITLIWCISTVILPILNMNISPKWSTILLLCLERSLFVFAITLPFDIRDMAFDRSRALATIPLLIGEQKSFLLAYAALLFAFLLGIINYLLLPNAPQIAILTALTMSYLITGYCISQSNPQRSRQFYTGLLDGMMILQFFLIFLMTFLWLK